MLIRGQRHTNNDRINMIIEDPIFRDSRNSLLHQMNDVIAYCVRQNYEPNAFMKKKGWPQLLSKIKKCCD